MTQKRLTQPEALALVRERIDEPGFKAMLADMLLAFQAAGRGDRHIGLQVMDLERAKSHMARYFPEIDKSAT